MEQNSFVQEVNAADSTRTSCMTSLLAAIETQPTDIVKEMIKAKRRSIELFNVGYKALKKAIELGRKDLVNYLLDKNCKVNLEKKIDRPATSPLHLAVRIGDMDLVERLLKANASVTAVDEKGNTPLHLAFLHKNEAIIDRLLLDIQKRSIYVNMTNYKGLTHMHIACTRKNVDVIKRFLNDTTLTVTPVKNCKKKRVYRKVKIES